jgi:hypothetical protein
MLDPWTALSLAATITQFVDFGAKLVSSAKIIREKGSSLDFISLKQTTEDLKAILEVIQDEKRTDLQYDRREDEEKVGSSYPRSGVPRHKASRLSGTSPPNVAPKQMAS